MRSRVAYLFVTVVATVLLTATAASGGPVDDLLKLSFYEPVYVSQGPAYQAAEPSIRVDESDPTQRIWITAPMLLSTPTTSRKVCRVAATFTERVTASP